MRRDEREKTQDTLKTKLKQVTFRRAAQSKTLRVKENFNTASLPVSSGGWSGLRQRFDDLLPQVEELLGDEHEMQLVNWNGEYIPFLPFLPPTLNTFPTGMVSWQSSQNLLKRHATV